MQFNVYESEQVQSGLDLWIRLEGEINPNDNGGVSFFGINSRWNKEAVAQLVKIQDPKSRMVWAKRYLFQNYWPKDLYPTADACLVFHTQRAWSTPLTRSLTLNELKILIHDPFLYAGYLATKYISEKGVITRLNGLKDYLQKFDI